MMLETSTLRITPQMLSLVAEIDELKGAWGALGTLAPERLSALRRVATIDSVGASTRIEGSRLSDREVERLLANLEIKAFASRDEQEVAGYADVMETVFAAWSEITVTENHASACCSPHCRDSRPGSWITPAIMGASPSPTPSPSPAPAVTP